MPDRNFYPEPTWGYPQDIMADSLFLRLLGEIPDPEFRLYNIGGTLFWNGSSVALGVAWQAEGGTGPGIYYAAGNVAVGKNTASYPLDIHGVVKTDDSVIIANNKQIQFQDTLGGVTAYAYRDTSDDLVIVNTASAKDIQLTTNAGEIAITGNAKVSGSLKLLESTGATYHTIIQAGDQSADITYTLPATQAEVSSLLQNDGAGVLSWGLNPSLVTFEPTGFPNRTDSTISISTQTFTIAPAVTSFDVYVQGVKFTKTGTQSVTVPDVAGQLNYIYYDSTGTLSQGTSLPNLGQNAIVATVYWNGTTALLAEERHGLTMDWATHYYLHHTIGAVWDHGLAGTFAADNTFSITEGEIDDEDIEIDIPGPQTTCRVLYRDVALSTTMSFGAVGTAWWVESGGVIAYDNAGTLDPVPVTNYVSYWIFATPDPTCPIYSLAGQRIDATYATAIANQTYSSLDLSTTPNNEMKLLYRLLVQNVGGTETIIQTDDYRTASNRIVLSHSGLSNLSADDHAQYLLHDRTSDAQGQVLYHNGTNWISLAPGTDGYFLRTQGIGANPKWDYPVRGGLTETTSSVLTITGGTNAVWGSGATIQVIKADASNSGYLLNTDWSDFDGKYDGLPNQTGNANRYLMSGGTEGSESWSAIVSSAVAGYTSISFDGETSVTVTHNFGAEPIVQVRDSSGAVLIPLSITHTNTNEFVVAFSGATTGVINASVGSPYIQNITSKTTDYTLTASDTLILGNAEITLTLPTAVGVEGKTYMIKNIKTDVYVTAKGDGVELIDTDNEFKIPPQSAIGLVSDGTQWWVI